MKFETGKLLLEVSASTATSLTLTPEQSGVILYEIDRLQQASRWIPVSNPPKHPNWVIVQDLVGSVFPATFKKGKWTDDLLDPNDGYPDIVKWREMPPPEGE